MQLIKTLLKDSAAIWSIHALARIKHLSICACKFQIFNIKRTNALYLSFFFIQEVLFTLNLSCILNIVGIKFFSFLNLQFKQYEASKLINAILIFASLIHIVTGKKKIFFTLNFWRTSRLNCCNANPEKEHAQKMPCSHDCRLPKSFFR